MKTSRRNFLKSTGTIIAASQVLDLNSACTPIEKYNAKGLPTAVLGKTGVKIPRLAIGLGSRFCNIETLEEALELLNYSLDNGLYYWDTAHEYVNLKTGVVSEERLGHVVKNRRNEIFLSTKLTQRDPDKAKAELELSLKRLQTDHVDILKIHSIEKMDDVENILKKGGVLDVITKAKEQGMTRFIGFSGHGLPASLKALVDSGRFDTMLFALNQWGGYKEDRQGQVIPAALDKKMGIMLMKSVRPKDTIAGVNPSELIRFALSLKGPHGLTVGMDSKKIVDTNINLLRNFKPMTDDEKQKYVTTLAPFFRHENLPWAKEGYRDGNWG